MERILSSSDLRTTDRNRHFLRFIVEETLSGRSGEIKGFTIATKVFGRKNNFDPHSDPIVRIEAGRLRRALERYYLTAGKDDPVHINIPKGTYVPAFEKKPAVLSNVPLSKRISKIPSEDSWPSLLVRPFKNLTDDPGKNYLAAGLANELAVEITRFQETRVLLHDQKNLNTKFTGNAFRFIIDGDIRKDKSGIKVTLSLSDTQINAQIWGDTHWADLETSLMISLQEKVAQAVAAKIAGEQGMIARVLSTESKNKPLTDLKTYEAILRFYEYDQELTPESFLRALEALEHASVANPECGQIWTMLGRLYGSIYALELPGFETALDKAVKYAERGVQLNPDNQRSKAVLAYIRMFCGEILAARQEVERAYALNPNSLFMLDGIGYLMTLLGEWKRGPELIRRVIELNPYYKPIVHYALWLNYFRQGKYKEAHLETLNFRTPAVFWDSLAKAATYGCLRKYKKGQQAVMNLLRLKPDFQTRGRILIKHFIKFDDIVDKVIKGLHKVGLEVQ